MSHFRKITKTKSEGKVIYKNGIVDGIVIHAISEVPHVKLFYASKPRKIALNKSVKVYFDKDGVSIDVNVKIHFSQCVSDSAFKIQETIRHSVESMTDYRVSNVNVNVLGVTFEDVVSDKNYENADESQSDSEKLSDKEQNTADGEKI